MRIAEAASVFLVGVAILFCAAGPALADPPSLIKDINGPHQSDAAVVNLTNVNGILFFSSDANDNGYELWRSDGTDAGTYMVKDISPGPGDSSPGRLIEMGGICYLFANDGTYGNELWRSDGTEAGTWIVKDIAAGPASSWPGDAYIYSHYCLGTRLFFSADDGIHGAELWCTDGTEAGTYMLADINPFGASNPQYMAAMNGLLYFMAYDGSGTRLWRSDGTAPGTCQVSTQGGNNLTQCGGKLFFTNKELYISDGTESGTGLLKDINTSGDSYPGYLTDVNGVLFFKADGSGGQELWKSDGTSGGTVLVKDINPSGSSYPQYLTAVGNTLYFAAEDAGSRWELWKSDGTATGTVKAAPGLYSVADIRQLDNALLFRGTDLIHGVEIFSYDLSSGAVTLITDVYLDSPPAYSVTIYNPTVVDDKLFFRLVSSQNPACPDGLYVTDGTVGNCSRVKDLTATYSDSSAPIGYASVAGRAFFVADDDQHGLELWKTDGTTAGTSLIKDINPSGGAFPVPTGSPPPSTCTYHDMLLFQASNGIRQSLWKSDGSTLGTVVVKDIWAAGNDFLEWHDKVYFPASDGVHGYELWTTDGTEPNTVMVKDIYTGAGNAVISGLAAGPGFMVFGAADATHGFELWRSDGTEAGTRIVKDIVAGSTSSLVYEFDSSRFLVAGDRVYFVAATPDHGRELWATDGSEAGTYMVKDINPTGSSSPSLLAAVGDVVLCGARPSSAAPIELWRSDGTEAGTTVLRVDIRPYTDKPHILWNGILYFFAGDSLVADLWRSDGTAAGTWMVKDLEQSYSTMPWIAMDLINNRLVFTTYAAQKYRLWVSDGTEAGTSEVEGLFDGMLISTDYKWGQPGFTKIGNSLLFSADYDYHPYGYEPWLLRMDIGDTDLSGTVDFVDFATLAANWLRDDCNLTNDWCDSPDITDYGKVDIRDLALFTNNWLVD